MIKRCLLLNLSMSSTGSLSIKDSAFGSGHCKRFKKKRHRNKFRNSNLRKKRLKKYYSVKKTNSFKLTNPKCNPDSDKIMSNWYWSNYKRAVEWQERHKIAYWKACALALLEENRYLLQIINDIQPGMVPKVSITQSNLGEGINYNRKHLKVNPAKYFTSVHVSESIHNVDAVEDEGDEYNDNSGVKEEDEEDDDIEFEMSEEMMQFFKQSYRHKMNLKKLKEKELLNEAEQKIKQIQTNKIKRSTEMNLLYGDEASMIIGMETAIQLSFDKYCDTKSPKYWPNIPFRL